MIQKDVEQIVAIVLARAGAERRKAEANPEGDFVYLFRVGDSDCFVGQIKRRGSH